MVSKSQLALPDGPDPCMLLPPAMLSTKGAARPTLAFNFSFQMKNKFGMAFILTLGNTVHSGKNDDKYDALQKPQRL